MRSNVSNKLIGALTVGLFAAGALADSFSLFAKVKAAGETGPGSEIEVPVSSGFGVYKPYAVPRYRPQVGLREPAVAANFSNVVVADPSFSWGYFSAGERALLQKNDFVARPEAIGTFGQAYAPELSSQDMGSFITVDAVLHGLRVTVDEAMRDMEKNYAAPALRDQLDELAQSVASGASAERSQSMVAAGLQLLAYIQTGQVLLDPSAAVDPRVSNEVSTEVRNIKAAAGRGVSAVFPGRAINYAIFAPVGYYTIDPKLGSYYRAKTWLSTVGFNLRTQSGEPDLVGVRAAALLARTIDGLAQGDFRDRYEDVNEPLAFFSGSAAQGSSYGVLASSMKSYYGRMASVGTTFLNDDESLRSFVGYMEQQLPSEFSRRGAQPLFRILDWGGDAAGQGEMAQLWSDAGSSSGSYGLAVMGALGSGQAGALQDAGSFRTMFSRQPAESWTQDLGHTVLYTVQPLAVGEVRPEGYPRFMRSDAWTSRELTTALGAWADFQHGASMMQIPAVAKAGSVSSGGRSSDLRTDGYVEPNPEAWARVASMAGYLRNGLTEERSDKMIGRKVELKLQDIENVSAKLMQIAAAELSGTDLTDEQLELIRVMPSRIAAYETFADKSLQGEGYAVTAGAARVAGATVASGHPLAVYVIVPRNDGEDGLMLTRGAIASYYESGTSADEMIRSLTTPSSPIRPDARLVGSYVSSDKGFAQDARKLQAVTASMPGTVAAYVPTKQEQKQIAPKADLSLESTVVSRSGGELWFTVHAPQLEGNDLVVTVAGTNGQTVLRSEIGRVQNGERFDVIRIGNLNNGQYFIRVADLAGKPIASGRFMVVR